MLYSNPARKVWQTLLLQNKTLGFKDSTPELLPIFSPRYCTFFVLFLSSASSRNPTFRAEFFSDECTYDFLPPTKCTFSVSPPVSLGKNSVLFCFALAQLILSPLVAVSQLGRLRLKPFWNVSVMARRESRQHQGTKDWVCSKPNYRV